MELYEKHVSSKGKVSYTKFTNLPELKVPVVSSEYNNEELITWTCALATTQIMILEESLPEHSFLARTGKVTAVRVALLDLYKGLGKPLNSELVDYITDTWNLAIKLAMMGLIKQHESQKEGV